MSTLENSITPTISHNTIEARVLDSSMTYAAYIENVNALIAQGKASTNDASNDEEHLHFTQLNQSRMKRLDKTTHLSSETVAALSNWKTPVYFLVISEGWCGDAAQILPVINKMTEVNANMKMRVIYRDEHLNIIDQYLTNGGRAIPIILIVRQEDGIVLGKYGPRPDELSKIMVARKVLERQFPVHEQKAFFEESKALAQKWYNENKTIDIQNGLIEILEKTKHS